MTENKNILVRIGVKPNKETKTCVTNLDKWLAKKNIKFESVSYVSFESEVMLATVEFDRNNVIYIILPKNVFEEEV